MKRMNKWKPGDRVHLPQCDGDPHGVVETAAPNGYTEVRYDDAPDVIEACTDGELQAAEDRA